MTLTRQQIRGRALALAFLTALLFGVGWLLDKLIH